MTKQQGQPHLVLHHDHHTESLSENKLNYIERGGSPLQPKGGTWVNASFHLMSALAAPSLLSLPYAIAGLGWGFGILALCLQTGISFYSCYMLSLVLENMEEKGQRCLTLCHLAHHLLGFKWAHFVVAPAQFTVCFISIVGYILLGGQTMKGIYSTMDRRGHIPLHYFILMFGGATMLLSQVSSVHSLRHFTLISALMCLSYSICVIMGSLLAGESNNDSMERNYDVAGGAIHRFFDAFICMSMMVETYGNLVVVEIQATLASPIKGKMLKSLTMCYVVTTITFFLVAICGYWAFGQSVDGIIFGSMDESWRGEYHIDVPKYIYVAGNTIVLLQVVVVTMLFAQPTFEVLEGMTQNNDESKYSMRNMLPRLMGRSLFVLVATILANLFPYLLDIVAINGSLGYIPLCIILPLLFYNKTCSTHDTTSGCLHYWINLSLIVLFSSISVIGCTSTIHQIIINSKSEHF